MTLIEKYYERKKIDLSIHEKIVFDIIADFTDRRGLKSEWSDIDTDIKEEIIETWINIVQNNLNK